MLNLGELLVKIKVDDKGMKNSLKGLEKDATKSTNSMGTKFSALGKTMGTALKAGAVAAGAALAALGAATIKIGKDALKAYADYEQLSGGVEKIFGEETAKKVEENAKRAFKTAGMSANQYMETVTGFSATLLKDLGGNTEEAARYADMAIQDMSDNANTFGTDIQSIQNAYQGFAKGNATMLDNLKVGYGGTKKELLQLAKDMGVVDESVKSFDEISFPQAIDAIHKVQEELNITGTTAKEAAQTLEGSANAMKASWQNLLTAMGTGDDAEIARAMEDFTNSVTTYLENFIPRVKIIFDSMFKVLGEYISSIDWSAKIQDILTKIGTFLSETLPTAFNGAMLKLTEWLSTQAVEGGGVYQGLVNFFKGLVQSIIKLLPGLLLLAVDLVALAGQLLNALMEGLITGIADLFVQLWVIIGPYVTELWENIKTAVVDFFTGIWDWITTTVNNIWTSITTTVNNIWTGIKTTLTNAYNGIKSIFTKVKNTIVNTLTSAKDKVKSIFESIRSIISDKASAVLNKAKSIFQKVKDAITNPIDKAKDLIKGIIDKIKGFFSFKVPTPHIPLPHFAITPSGWKIGDLLKGSIPGLSIDWYKDGGFFNGPTVLSGVGEDGPEYVLPLSRRSLAPLAQLMNEMLIKEGQTRGALESQPLIVNTDLYVDGRKIASTTAPYMRSEIRKINTSEKRQKGLY